jgi:hypothetical protein
MFCEGEGCTPAEALKEVEVQGFYREFDGI